MFITRFQNNQNLSAMEEVLAKEGIVLLNSNDDNYEILLRLATTNNWRIAIGNILVSGGVTEVLVYDPKRFETTYAVTGQIEDTKLTMRGWTALTDQPVVVGTTLRLYFKEIKAKS